MLTSNFSPILYEGTEQPTIIKFTYKFAKMFFQEICFSF